MDYAAALIEQNQMLGELLRDADWSMPVPICPGWTLLQLLRHVGRGDRWAAQIIADRADASLDPRLVRDGSPPSLPAGTSLALRAADPHLKDTTWAVRGTPQGVRWTGQPAASADLVLSGPAADLLLALVRRRPVEDTGISLQGDTTLWRSWLALTPL